jgi:putative membrane protein
MKAAVAVAALLGLMTLAGVILHEGIPALTASLINAGWVLLLLAPFHALPLLLDVLGWRVLIGAPTRLGDLFVIASIREAINRLLPVANIGGEIVGIRLLTKCGIAMPLAASTVIVETLMNLISQYVFVAVGVLCLLQLTHSVRTAGIFAVGLAASLPVLALIAIFLHRGSPFAQIERIARRLFNLPTDDSASVGFGPVLDDAVSRLLGSPFVLVKSCAWQVAGYVVGSAETWAALRWLGHPVGSTAAIALESLTQAARSLIFLVPAGLGVQEVSLVAVGYVLGINATIAVSLSLAKRMRELLFGLPSLAAWAWMELRFSAIQPPA